MENNIIVTVSCANMRSWGRQALSGRWSVAVLGTILYMSLTLIPVIVFRFLFDFEVMENMANIYVLIISGPISLGYTSFMIAIFRRRPTSPYEVLYGFERFVKAFLLYIVMNFFILLWTLLFIIPGIIAAYRYALSFYVLVDNPEIGIFQAIKESKRMMKGNKWRLFCLEISFIGWVILSLLTMGIGYIWLIPYMTASTVGFYEVANGNLRREGHTLTEKTDTDKDLL